MIRSLLIVLLLLFQNAFLFAQDQGADEIVAEGTKLYRAEFTSWNAQDLFSENYPEKSDLLGGSFSYEDHKVMKCVFFSKAANPTVIATAVYDSSINLKTGYLDKKERTFTPLEADLYNIQLSAIIAVASDDIFFKRYANTSLVMVPLIDSTAKKVYIMTGVRQSCMVIFGNDYLLLFDEHYRLFLKKYLHKNIIPVECAKDITIDNNEVPGTMHIHNAETGDLPTVTDICNLLLYAQQANWKQHTIFSPEHVYIWSCEQKQLTVMTKEAWRIRYAGKKK